MTMLTTAACPKAHNHRAAGHRLAGLHRYLRIGTALCCND